MVSLPKDILLGFASSAYQIEGGWNADGRGECVWDNFVHNQSSRIADKSNGDIASDSYRKFKEDVALIKEMSGEIYRFSISWSRILPTGHINDVNQAGIEYYNNLIDELIANNIEPLVTLYHWDLPQSLQELGGWTNEKIADYFEDFARLAFSTFGDRVKKWITINEPWEIAHLGYGVGIFPPGFPGRGVAEYLAAHTLLKAHAKAYHVYDDEFRPLQKGVIGITMNFMSHEPLTDDPADIEAANEYFEFHVGWFANPIFSAEGDYPEVMKRKVATKSKEEGFSSSRLPVFDEKWVSFIRGTSDFFGVNHYTSHLISKKSTVGKDPSWENDVNVTKVQPDEWPRTASIWFRVKPTGFRLALATLKAKYNNPVVYVTENGFSDRGNLEDDDRIAYFNDYLHEMVKAITLDGVNVKVYTAWSLLDSYEWTAGYTERFGIIHVDFDDPERKRTPKKSSSYFKRIYANRRLDP